MLPCHGLAARLAGERGPVKKQGGKSVRRGTETVGYRPGLAWHPQMQPSPVGPMRDRQATRAFGGRSGTATTALLADVRRKGMAVDGCASGRWMTTLGGSAVQTTQAVHAGQRV
ncbi:hypothetical protein PBR20603_00457 [Pandoraea bronchicola]|uniref:Uncharacterized protein n=1 Tax=Pandoraea bronchicola TaxID=2508287 RepID=A0A5E5BMP0_9BURK|nr:hypothetical protein PBR20603_00457 [Pandoraea bronchicola]